MTIREYWDAKRAAAETMDDFDEVCELEMIMYRVLEENEDDFTVWASEEGIDLTARDENLNELVLTLWCWDMCGD